MVWNSIAYQSLFNKFFEEEVALALDDGLVSPPIYLSLGSEHIPPTIIHSLKLLYNLSVGDFYLFAQHRCHSYYLSLGCDPYKLAMELCGRAEGCNKGYGGSASISDKYANMMGHSGLLGDQVPIGVGFASASNIPSVVVMGDAAAEEDYVLGALGHAVTKKAPVIFIVEDNNLSILTEKQVRRSWNIVDVAKGMGIEALDINDNPKDIFSAMKKIKSESMDMPYLLNINCERFRWHAGSGIDNEPSKKSLSDFLRAIEYDSSVSDSIQNDVKKLWDRVRHECS